MKRFKKKGPTAMQIHIKMPDTYSFALTNLGTNYNNLNGREISGLSSLNMFSMKIKDILMYNTPKIVFFFLATDVST